jgi:glycine/D-amino acid oxidase-like deaminating enzyme/nitrite reductase/ring-hydroxylating ferredoxin subunit
MATASLPEFPPVSAHLRTGVCIVGAGISGLTTAYLLAREGRPVVVIDDGPIVSGETERTTAHLSNALDDRYHELERLFGEEGMQLAAESHTAAIDTIERICREENIDCGFSRVDGYLFNPSGVEDDNLRRELEAAHRAGLSDVEMVERAPLISFNTGPALLFPRQGQFHPLRYLAALARAITRLGGSIFSHTHATKINGGPGASVETHHGWRIECEAIVVATNTPINDRVTIHTRQRPYRTYVIGLSVPVGTIPRVLYWDTEDPYHYVRLESADPTPGQPARDVLIVGGEDHETGQANDTEDRFVRLERWTRERFPMAGEVRFRWSGQVMEPVDALAYIGRNPGDADNVYIATGDSGHGMTHGTIAGLLLTDLLQGRTNRWAELYNPSRLVPHAATEYVADNLHMAAQYADWFTRGDAATEDDLPAGCGAVIRRGAQKVAIYRDELGRLHECSAVCPHLGGIVNWNDTEKTWDCPVHGSRFDPFGEVVNGPANTNLKASAPAHP